MKQVELDDATFVALERLATAKSLSPAGLIAALLGPGRPPLAGDSLLFFLTGAEFSARADATARYLALLAWVARNYARDFADFISHQESGRRYLTLNRDEFNDVRAHHQAVQLAGTQYWAVLNIDDPTKRRFLCRLLEFIGCHDETVTQACCSLGLLEAPGFRQRSG
jgi:negative modulator of initiation of replication